MILVNGVVAFGITVFTIEFWLGRADDLPEKELRMLRLVFRQVMQDHVEPHAPDELLRFAIDGMVEGLHDKHSKFVPGDRARAFDSETTGEYQGIGIGIVPDHIPITVRYLLEDSPAERGGIAVGDRIVQIDGERLDQVTKSNVMEEARRRLLGAPGSTVRVVVQRGADVETEIELTRGVQGTSVKWARLVDQQARIGYLYVSAFQQRTAAELDHELRFLEEQAGGALEGLVLDLRHNPGGLLTESIAVANRFLTRGNIVSLRARGDVEHARHDVDPSKTTHPSLPLVLLVNDDSASASEVLCGALQDHQRAAVVGAQTYGKAVVQSIYRWDGLDFRLKLTTSRYLTPNGRSLGRIERGRDGKPEGGITPDVEVALPPKVGEAARVRLQDFEVPRRYKAAAAALALELGFEGEAEPLGPEQDAQLGRALEVLRERMARAAPEAGNSAESKR